MRAFVYRNTATTVPGGPFHERQPRGIAYESGTHFIHRYGVDRGLWAITSGLTVTQRKTGSLRDWVVQTFGAVDIAETRTEVGNTTEGVWRPGLFFSDETMQGLGATDTELRKAKQALLAQLQQLEELVFAVESAAQSWETRDRSSKELLALACTEVESYWNHYMRRARSYSPHFEYTPKHYAALCEPLFLYEFEVTLRRRPRFAAKRSVLPFSSWAPKTKLILTLPWYEAFQRSKDSHAAVSTDDSLGNCIQAIAANVALFSARFGPVHLLYGNEPHALLFNELFSLGLCNPDPESFYAPLLTLHEHPDDLTCFVSRDMARPYNVLPFRIARIGI